MSSGVTGSTAVASWRRTISHGASPGQCSTSTRTYSPS
jgi:hypothetical protein